VKALRSPVIVAALACVVLPFALRAGGLTMTSATDVVIFSIACMALNILVGHTGLVSFGHGAWFGVGAYAAALAQRHWFPGSIAWPSLFALAFLVAASMLIGFLVLRRRGVYFSLLTLAFSALTYAVAFRWTTFTGGENGLGGVTRAVWLGVDLANPWVYYAIVAAFGVFAVYALSMPCVNALRPGREQVTVPLACFSSSRMHDSLQWQSSCAPSFTSTWTPSMRLSNSETTRL